MCRSLLLAALVVAVFTATAAQQGGAAPNGATIAAAAGGARLDEARVRSESIDGKRFDIASPKPSGVTGLERLRSVFLRVLDSEARAAEGVTLFPGPFDLHLIQVGGVWAAYAEFGGKVYRGNRAIEASDSPLGQQRTFRRASGCWWLWLVTGMQVCREAHA